MHRKRKTKPVALDERAVRWPPSKRRLRELVGEAIVDAYNEDEQRTGLFTMLEEHLAVPFETQVLGVPVTVERVDLTRSDEIIALCRRGKTRQAVSILDLPLPKPPPVLPSPAPSGL